MHPPHGVVPRITTARPCSCSISDHARRFGWYPQRATLERVRAAFAGAVLLCEEVIAKSTPLSIIIEARDYNGTLIDSVGPYTDFGGGASSWDPAPGAAYCKFIFPGSPKSIRAQAVYVDPATGHRMVAIPAR